MNTNFERSVNLAVTRYQLGTSDAACFTHNRGSLLRVERGSVWITEHGKAGDTCLTAGQTYRVEGDGMTVATAMGRDETAVVTLVGEARLAQRVRQVLDRVAGLVRPHPFGSAQ